MTSILKVSEIQDPTNSNTAISIDAAGNTTFPNPVIITTPVLLVAYSNTTITSQGVIPYNQVVYDTASAHNTSTSRYTCTRAGYYEVSYNYLLRNGTSGHRSNVRKNGINQNTQIPATNNDASLVWNYVSGGSEQNISASTIVQCAVNDILDVHLYTIGAGDLYGASNVHNQLTIKLL
jgi:hypothetical protein